MSTNETRDLLFKHLDERDPSLAAHLRAAVDSMGRPGGIGLKMAAHAVREFGALLPGALGVKRKRREDAKQSLARLAPRWVALPRPVDSDSVEVGSGKSPEVAGVRIDPGLFRDTQSAFRELESADDFVDIMAAMVRILDPLGQPAYHAKVEAGVRDWFQLHQWFVERCHARDLDALEKEREVFLRKYELYEASLGAIFSRAIDTMPELMDLATKPPTDPAIVEQAIALLKKAEHRRRFFHTIADPAWLRPLDAAGFFQDPFDPVREGQIISFPPWPQSQYLIKVAAAEGKLVAEILRRLGATENDTVRADFVVSATEMDIAYAASLVPVFVRWLRTPILGRLSLLLGKLVTRLAAGGACKEASKLLGAMLQFDPPEADVKYFRRVRPRLGPYEVGMTLNETETAMVEKCGEALLDLTCARLRAVIVLEHGKGEDDFSYIWKEALDASEEYEQDVKAALATAVVRTSIALAARSEAACGTVLDRLAKEDASFFRRVTLHVLATCPGTDPRRRAALMDRSAFGNYGIRPEYDALLAAAWPSLEAADRSQIIEWTREDSDPQWFVERETERRGQPPTEEEIREFSERRQVTRLEPVAGLLEGADKAHYNALKSRVEPFERPSRGVISWVGPTSPMSPDDLAGETPQEVLKFLRAWVPEEGVGGASPEGLLRVLVPHIGAHAKEWAPLAPEFQDRVRPTFVRAFVEGVTEAATDPTLEWKPVLTLCEWILSRTDSDETSMSEGEDLTWLASRRSVADLLRGALREKLGLPFEHREQVLAILNALSRDSDPKPSDATVEARDLATEALNSTRGKALHAIVEYALWCARNLKAQGRDPESWFDEIPEAKALFEQKIDPASEKSESIRAVLLQYLPNLGYLDRKWHEQAILKLLEPLGAVWDAYVLTAPVYQELAPVLGPLYLRAAERTEHKDSEAGLEVEDRFADHVLLLYVHFRESVPQSDDILRAFFQNASVRQRAQFIRFAGWHAKEGNLPPAGVKRLMEVLERRITAVSASGNTEDREELAAWEGLFGAPTFPDDWLLKIARIAIPISPGHRMEQTMAQRVGSMADRDLVAALEILSLVANKDLGPWGTYNWNESAMKVLGLAIAAGGELKGKAESTINAFTEQGYSQFEPLLRAPEPGKGQSS